MLRLLTDEQASPAVAKQLKRRCRGIEIIAMRDWEDGNLMSASDEALLREARRQKLTVVTFDLRTIPALLRAWAEHGEDHGVSFSSTRGR